MATDDNFARYLLDQMRDAGSVSVRKMFGEYAVYCQGKVVALICNNQLFVKPTKAGAAFLGPCVEKPPYPGAKNYFLMEDHIEDRFSLSKLIRLTADDLPLPKIKIKRKIPRKKKERR